MAQEIVGNEIDDVRSEIDEESKNMQREAVDEHNYKIIAIRNLKRRLFDGAV